MPTEFETLIQERTRPAENIAAVKLFYQGNLVSIIPNIPGKKNSVRILSQYQHEGKMTREDIANALEIYAPFLNEARAQSGKHPTIDLLLSIPEGHELTTTKVYQNVNGAIEALVIGNATPEQKRVAVELLGHGQIRCAEKIYSLEGQSKWHPQLYAIDAMNAAFNNDTFGFKVMPGQFYDKVPLKTEDWNLEDFQKANIRFIPGSFVRIGAYLGPGTTIMPGGIVNTGAYIAGDGVMVDGGARVATGAQVGTKVKIGAGSGLEGILEPRGRLPTIVEDNVRIGANCEVAGLVEEGAVLGSGVIMASGKKIYDLRTGEVVEPLYMRAGENVIAVPHIPKNRVAVAGVYNREVKGQNFGIDCILLLEKDAQETTGADIPKNAQLYL